ncbi:MAG: hypothetical protein RLZZ383_1209 [Pseudomonadota bacterium]|jgi:hypothetical protein
MKIDVEWMVLAERVIEDRATHSLTLVGCLSELRAPDFPALHHGFAVAARLRCRDRAPETDATVSFRLQRFSTNDPEQTILETSGTWPAGARSIQWVTNFQVLRLLRAETVHFRLDHRAGPGAWRRGPVAALDVLALGLSDEERAAVKAHWRSLLQPSGTEPS